MGSRQSVVQHQQPRHRALSHPHVSTSALNNGHHQATPGPSASGASTASQQNSGVGSSGGRKQTRQVRSQSVVMPVFSSPAGTNTSGESSDDDAVAILAECGGSGAVASGSTPSTSGGVGRRTPSARGLATGAVGSGLPALDRLLHLNAAFANSGILMNRVPFRFFDITCPVCHKIVPSDDVEYHLVVCLTRPRLTYNEDILLEDKGECPICFDEMCQGTTIARLPCLCVYHKGCIDSWFNVKNSCPEHPSDD